MGILSACSPFFKAILFRNKHEHPLLYLKGILAKDMEALLNFMYHGEVNVAQDGLNSFLQVAEDLKIKGLTQNNPGCTKSQSKNKDLLQPQRNLHCPLPPDPGASEGCEIITSPVKTELYDPDQQM